MAEEPASLCCMKVIGARIVQIADGAPWPLLVCLSFLPGRGNDNGQHERGRPAKKVQRQSQLRDDWTAAQPHRQGGKSRVLVSIVSGFISVQRLEREWSSPISSHHGKTNVATKHYIWHAGEVNALSSSRVMYWVDTHNYRV